MPTFGYQPAIHFLKIPLFYLKCHRARGGDWFMCEGSRVMGVTSRMPRGVISAIAEYSDSLLFTRVELSAYRCFVRVGEFP